MNAFYEQTAKLDGEDAFGPPPYRLPELPRRPSARVTPDVLERALKLRDEGFYSTQISVVMRMYHDVTLKPGTWQKVMREAGAPHRKMSHAQFGAHR